MIKYSLAFLVVCFISLRVQAQKSDFADTDFSMADSIAAIYRGQSLRDLKTLAGKLTTPLQTEEEKFRSIYKWICDNIENDFDFYELNKNKREHLSGEKLNVWNKKFRARVLDKLFNEQSTVCTGYAYLVMKLSTYAGLRCVIVDGYGRTAQANIGGTGIPNHSWNAIQLHDKWYLCDATWSSGAIDTEKRVFVKRYEDSYFLAAPSLFIRNHYPLDSNWMLIKDKPTLHEFLNRPLLYSNIYRYQIDQLFPETFNISTSKGETIAFSFKKNNEKIEKVELRINNSKAKAVQLYESPDGVCRIDQVFGSRGTYIVHIILDSGYLSTYKVNVR
jgi:transglutaminase/protease-like cytokinesis protein 3